MRQLPVYVGIVTDFEYWPLFGATRRVLFFFFSFFYGLLILAEVCMSEYFCCEKWRFPVEAIKSVSRVVQFSKDRERMVLINVTHICVWSVCICVCVSACARLCVH